MNPDIYFQRIITRAIRKQLNRGKVIIVYGARQVGKTTLLKNLFLNNKNTLYLSCDQLRVREQLIPDSLILKRVIGNKKNIIFDEAQYLDNPGLVLKILIDNYPEKNIIASGSSSFDLAHKLSEPLTGRHSKFILYPLSLLEIFKTVSPIDFQDYFNQSLIFGSYPKITKLTTNNEKIDSLLTLTDSYLYKDVLTFNLVKNSHKVRELLILLALQIGSEVSYSELANNIGIDRKTVEYYLDLLEKSFVIFRLYGFSRNLRSEINRKVKIYFYDLGIRNALINNFNQLNKRSDSGVIFENFIISEMLKKEAGKPQKSNFYFWRTYNQKEIDLITEKNGLITAFEIKIKMPKKVNFQSFKKVYNQAKTKIITMNNLEIFYSKESEE